MMQLSLDQGRTLKEEGIGRVLSNNRAFLEIMRMEAMRLSRQRGWVTSDDLRVYASQLNIEPTHQNAWGAVFRGPRWHAIGRRKSAVPESHAREIRIWQYMERNGT